MASFQCNQGLKGELGPRTGWVVWFRLGGLRRLQSVCYLLRNSVPSLMAAQPHELPCVPQISIFLGSVSFCCSHVGPLLFQFSYEPRLHSFCELAVTTILGPEDGCVPDTPPSWPNKATVPLSTSYSILFSSLTMVWHSCPSSLTGVVLHDALSTRGNNVKGSVSWQPCVGREVNREH